ncbi:MAG TPA: DUF3341 domain-containing protein [Tepidisphaeraceae bacterium]|jgi:hypothetical protein|nr:DUF3341 domain-containing protein [Tepidisphaeraceae bacterium]
MSDSKAENLFGLAAEFDTPEAVLHAALRIHGAGYRRADAFSPMPVEGLPEALGFPRTGVPLIVGIGGLCGACGGFFMLWFANVVNYTWNIGGRPPNSWEAFIPITFELAVLCAALSAVIGMLALNKLPMPYHPMFNLPAFDRASRDRFFIVIESADAQFDSEQTRKFLETLLPIAVTEVPR